MPPSEALQAGRPIGATGQVELRDQGGEPRRLADLAGRLLVVFFYPKDDTPGCTIEASEFSALKVKFDALECRLVGVSTDSVESHRAFAEKHGLGLTLLADEAGALAQAFGVMRNGRAARTTFVLDERLRLVRAFYDVGARGHAQSVLEFLAARLESGRMLGG